MELQTHAAPVTPMDALRALLGAYGDGNPAFQTQLIQLVQQLKKAALPELGERLARPGSTRGLKKMILSIVPKFDWPEWVPWLRDGLAQEPDLGVFDEGCAVLGSLGTAEAIAALRRLQELRTDADRKVILNRELGQLQPQQSLDYYVSRLREGQGNSRLAHQGARLLAVMATPADLPTLIDVHQGGDELTRRLSLRLIASLPGPDATSYLLQQLDQARRGLVEDQDILGIVSKLQTLPRASARQELLNRVAERLGEKAPGAAEGLKEALAKEDGTPAPHLQAFARAASSPTDHFLLECLTFLVEGKYARYNAFLAETASTLEGRSAQAAALCDQVAEALVQKLQAGEVGREETRDALAAAFRAKVGGDGLVQAFLRILEPGDESFLDELLQEPDLARRTRYLDILGAREEDGFVPFFLKAMNDPIVEVGFKAIHHLGKLPSSFPNLLDMFHSGQRDQLRLAIRVFGENHTRLAAEPLLDFIQKDSSDEILVEAVEALGNIVYPPATSVLLDLLHDGKPLNLQFALCRALGKIAEPEASLGLLQKAPNLKHPKVLILCLEGALSGFPSFGRPFPVDRIPDLLQLVERCCDEREGEGQRFRAMMSVEKLFTFDQKAYERLKDRFSDFLFEMRTREAWDRESNDKVAAVIKELGRCSASLGLLAQKESNIRTLLQKLPPTPPGRAEALLALRDAVSDPELILRSEFGASLTEAVLAELPRSTEWKELAYLCEIGGRLQRRELVDPIRDIFHRATGLGLKSAARDALARLGQTEADMARRTPIRTILVLEPSTFFRKRLLSALTGQSWEIREAADRATAEALLTESPTDLLLTESQDPAGELLEWIEAQWTQRRCRYVLLSASSRDLGSLQDQPWVIGVLFKPYPQDHVLQALQR